MAKIEYYKESKEIVELPNCFCGEEPELIEDFDEVGSHRYHHVRIQCPYCRAHTEGRGWNTFNPYYKAVEEATEDWITMIRRKK